MAQAVCTRLLLFMPLTDADYQKAAEELGCEPAALKAVAAIESNGDPFLPDGRVKILFEAHIFARYTKGQFDKTHPHISSPTWNRKLYKGGAAEWDRMAEAIELDRKAALMSASYGMFQIMGFNFALCGFTCVEDFVNAIKDEPGQLAAFIQFIKSNHLDDELRRKDWAGFARGFNGPGYKLNFYDTRLARLYEQIRAGDHANKEAA